MAGIVIQAILNCTIFGIRILHYSDNYTEAPLILMISLTIRFFLSDVLKDKNHLFKAIKRIKNKEVIMDNQYEPHDIRKDNENEKQVDYKEICGISKILEVFIGIILLYFILGMAHYALEGSAKMAVQVLFMVSNLVAMICVSLIGMRVKSIMDENSLFKEFIKREENPDFSKFKVTAKHRKEATAQQMLVSSRPGTFRLEA
ncbi:MAG: hypothetical protein JSV38_14330 [Desulfobacterales bacterium]|nr:MAG: hypothetical protein JSV38_14330 [Desulfobacterales bacterium]